MKRIFLLLSVFLTLFTYSCEVNFDPFGDYIEKYAFTCILKNNTRSQIAFLSRSYKIDGFDPYNYIIDPAITGADIRVWCNDSVYVFKDSSITRTDTSRYKTPLHFYYNKHFSLQANQPVELEVLLSNGKRLKSSIVTPAEINFDDESDVFVPSENKNILEFFWNEYPAGILFQSKMEIKYRQNINGEFVEKTREIPLRFVLSNNKMMPVYPKPSAVFGVAYDLDAVDKILREISADDPDKQNYAVYEKLIFNVTAYDFSLSKYASSISGSVDDLTVHENVSDYTNIDGGYGIFGAYMLKDYGRLRFLMDYIQSYGYKFIKE